MYFIFVKQLFYYLNLQYITIYNLQVFFDIVIYFIYIGLMRKHWFFFMFKANGWPPGRVSAMAARDND